MPLYLLIAWRFLKGAQQEKYISLMVKICFIGIFIGTCALALVLSIMTGFEQATHDKIKGIHADGIIRANNKILNYKYIKTIIEKEFKDSVKAISPSNTKQVLIYNPKSDAAGNLVALKGIDPASINSISTIATTIIEPKKYSSSSKLFSELFNENNIVIGSNLAKNLGLNIGDNIDLLFSESAGVEKNKIVLDSYNAIISGIFKTGIEEIDDQVIFCSLDLLEKIFGTKNITEIGFSLYPKNLKYFTYPKVSEQAIINKLRKRFSQLEIQSWKDLYPTLVAALILEKYALSIVLALIVLVASMNMISLISMYITQKRRSIAILKTVGMPDNNIRAIFIILGMSIATTASICGLIMAYCIAFFLQNYPLIKLPDIYYVTYLPVSLDLNLFFIVLLINLILSFIASWIPAEKIRKLSIAHMLKSEE